MKTRPKYNDYIKCKCSKCGNIGLQSVKTSYFQKIPEFDDDGIIGEYYYDYYLCYCQVKFQQKGSFEFQQF